MTSYIKMTDQGEAFDYIGSQTWTPHYKSVARYRWKLRHRPEQIRRRRRLQHKECPICYEDRPLPDFQERQLPCCHPPLVCSQCFEKLNSCPFCRALWKPKNMLIFRVPISLLNDVFNRNDMEILETMAEILHQISPGQN